MTKYSFLSAAVLVCFVIGGCEDAVTPPVSQASVEQPIVNGTPDPQTITLTDGQKLAIGWLHSSRGVSRNFCTATLVAPNVVATAQHCVAGSSANQIGFGVGDRPSNAVASFDVAGIYTHSRVDAAILLLQDDATEVLPEIEPIPFNREPITDADIGRELDAAGYGETYNTNPEGRWFARVYLDDVRSSSITVDGRGEQGICYGDSGGPVFWEDESGQVVVLAVESGGDSSCVGEDNMTRLDAIADDFIDPIMNGEAPEVPTDPCEGLDYYGTCDGEVARWCARGELRSRDCGGLGTACDWINDRVGYACTCGDLTYQGRCNGDVVEYCENGSYRQLNCAAQGGYCGFLDEETGYLCTEEPSCEPEALAGLCDGNTLVSCAAGRTSRTDCAGSDGRCVEGDAGASCVPVESEPDPGEGPDLELPDVVDDGPQLDDDEPGAGDDGGGCSQAGGKPDPSALLALGLLALVGRRRRQGAKLLSTSES